MMILRKVGLAVLGLSLLTGVGQVQAQTTNFVKPGDTVEIPLPVENANDNGDPGGDTISSMKVIVTGDSTFVTNPTESAAQSIAPGETKTFTPFFVVGANAVDGQTYTVLLKQVSPDVGIDPDPEDPASEVVVSFTMDRTPPITELQVLGSSETTTDGSLIISTSTPIGFIGIDPISNGVASGLSRILVILDGTTFSASSNSVTLLEGFHTLRFMGIDNVGNVENFHEIGIFSVPDAPPAAATPAWTTFFHDSRHTGRISGVGPTIPTSSWTAAIGSVDTQVAVSSDSTIYAISNNNLQAINPNGSTRWSFPVGNIPGFSAPSLSSSGVAYIGTATDGSCSPSSKSFLFAVNPDGTQKWALSVPGPACANAFAAFGGTNVGADGTVYVGNALDNNLYAVSPATGGIKWKYQLNSGSITFSVPAIAQDGTVYIGADGGFLHAVNPDGSLKWVAATGGTHPFAPSVTNDGTILIASDNFIQAFSPLGVNLWSFNGNTVSGFSGSIKATPAIGPDGSIYVSDSFRRIIALNPNGSLKWAFAGGSDLFNSKGFPIVDSQSNVYLAAFTNSTTGRGSVISLNPNGTLRWKFPVLDNLNSISLGENGAIYAGGNGGLFNLVQAELPASQLNVSAAPASLVAGQPTNITATATDSINRPVFGVPVTFSIITGSGTLSSNVVTTDPNGQAIVTYLTGLSDGLQQVRATTGALSGIANVTTVLSGPISSAWSLYSHDAQHTGQIFGAGPAVPFLGWTATVGVINSQVAVSSDNTVYVLSSNGLSAINTDGSSKWNFPVIGGGGFFSGPSLASNGAIYVGTPTDGSCLSSSNAFLYALKSDGTQKWALRVPGPRCLGALQAFSGTNVGVDGTIYAGNALDNNLYAVAPDAGGIKWKYQLNSGSITFSVPAIAQDGTIYIGADGGFLYAVNPNGSLKWVTATAGSHVFTPSITNNGTILVASDNFLQAFSSVGSNVWTFNGNSIAGFSGGIKATPVIGPDGSIYCSDSLRKIIALNSNGTLKWAFDGGADLFNSGGFPVVDSQSNIYAAAFTNSTTGHGSVISLNPDGTLRWKFSIQDNLNMIALGENGVVYTGGAGGKLYAIQKYYLAKSSDNTVELLSSNPAITVAVASTASANVTLALATATAQGLILASNIYDISLDTPLTPPGTLTFSFDPTLVDTNTLALFRFDGVQWSSSSATGITSQIVVNSPSNTVVATLAHTSLYALFSRDNLPPRTTLFIGNPKFPGSSEIFVTSMTSISLSALDDRQSVGDSLGLGVAHIYFSVDLSSFQAYMAPFSISTEGAHVVRYYSVDTLSQVEIVHTSTVAVDATAPSTQIQIAGSSTTDAQGNLAYSSATVVGFSGTDPVFGGVASGLDRIFFNVDGGGFMPFENPFTLGDGFHTLNFYGVDNVANAENPNAFSAFFGVAPSTVTWTGLAGNGDWHTPSNWQPQKVPGANDTAVLATLASVSVAADSPGLHVHNLILGDVSGVSAPILIISTGVEIAGEATLHKNSLLTQDTTALFRIGSLNALPGALINQSPNFDKPKSAVKLEVSGDFTLQAGANINVSGMGYAGGKGPGSKSGTSSGGSYGGIGGNSGGSSYGSLTDPTDLGSGGGRDSEGGGTPGAGGGAVLLKVGGTLTINGVINAGGGTAANVGGSGGTINIKTRRLAGSGTLKADGGNVNDSSNGGGGGRIAAFISEFDSSSLISSAGNGDSGGAGTIYITRPGQNPALTLKSLSGFPAGAFTPISSTSVAGSSLTLSDFTMGSSKAQFIGLTAVKITGMAAFTGANTIRDLSGEQNFPGGPTGFPPGSDVTIATMTFPVDSTLTLTGTTMRISSLTALGSVALNGNSTLEQGSAVEWTIGSLFIGQGSKLTHKANTSQKLYRVNVRVLGDMTIDGGKVVADGLGFTGGAPGQAGQGPGGGGAGSAVKGGGGGGYGGSGGIGQGEALGGLPYGSVSVPEDLGSGGGGSNGVSGGAGGGEILLSVGGTLIDEGTISANGANGSGNGSYGGGGGSGGTIRIAAGTLAGEGLMQVNGGNGAAGTVQKGGGGAGGRISGAALFTFGTIQAAGGAKGGIGAADGQAGTFFDPAVLPVTQIDPTFLNVTVSSFTVQWSGNGNLPGTSYLAQLSKFSDFSQAVSFITANTFASFTGLSSNSLYYARAVSLSRGLAAADFTLLGSTRTLVKPGQTWIGPSGGDWNNAANWDNGGVPVSTDPVVIDGNVLVVAPAVGAPISFLSLTLGKADGSTAPNLLLSTGVAFAAGSLLIHPNAALTLATLDPIRLAGVVMESNSKLAHQANVGVKQSLVNLDVSGDMNLQSGANINVSGMGYAGDMGPGSRTGVRSGGSYGGIGGSSGGSSYGSLADPTDLGSGGGQDSGSGGTPGAGGGAVLLKVGGTLTINGVINAGGGTASNVGGSGGTINIKTRRLAGSGTLKADGGNVNDSSNGGGGGRIAAAISELDSSSLITSAGNGDSAGSGTIYISRPGQNPALALKSLSGFPAGAFTPISSATLASSSLILGDFIMGDSKIEFSGISSMSITGMAAFTGANTIRDLSGEQNFPGGPTGFPPGSDVTIATMTFPVDSTLTLTGTTMRISSLTALGSVVLESGSVLEQQSLASWTIGSLLVKSGAKLTHKINSNQKLYAVNVRVLGAMTVEAGANINADGLGFSGGASGQMGFGPGAGAGSAVNGGGGAGYGGLGGFGHGGTLAGTSYGQIAAPDDLGSGGGGSNGPTGGAGGGQIFLSVGGALTVNGTISAKGISGNTNSSFGAGGGSGGTIYLSPLSLSGTGTLSATGGNGGSGSVRGGGGGAGGRISFTGQFTGTASVAGGNGGGLAQAGGFGTIGPFNAQSTQTLAGFPEASVSASQNVSLTQVEAVSEIGTIILATAAAQGIYPIGNIYNLGPEGVLFSPALFFTFRYSTAALASLNILEQDIFLYQFVPGTGLVLVPGQIKDLQRKEITVQITVLASNFGIFGPGQDLTAPITALQLTDGFQFTGAGLNTYLSSSTRIGFAAVDPIAELTASGVDFTGYRVDASPSAPFQLFAGPFNLPEGPRTIDFRSQDKAGNLEVARSSAVTVDATAPTITISSPSAGQIYVATRGEMKINFAAADNFDPNPRFSAALIEVEDRGSPRGGRPALVAVATGQIIEPLNLDDGLWRLEVTATDFVRNSTMIVSGVFEIVHDVQPPRSALAVGLPQAAGSSVTFVTARTSFTLVSADDLILAGDGIGLGAAFQRLSVDDMAQSTFISSSPTPGQVFASSFTLDSAAEGLRVLSYFAQDVIGNREAVQRTTVAVDNTPPIGVFSILGPNFTNSSATIFVGADARVAFSASDPALSSGIPGSGLSRIEVAVDTTVFTAYLSTIALSEGAHTVLYRSMDAVGNVENTKTLSVQSDADAPMTTLILGEPKFYAFGLPVLTPGTPIVLSSTDSASGVSAVTYRIDGGELKIYVSSFTLDQGLHDIEYGSLDNVGNAEIRRSAKVAVTSLELAALQGFGGVTGSGNVSVTGEVESNGKVSLSGQAKIGGSVNASLVVLNGQASVIGTISQGRTPLIAEPIPLEFIAALAQQTSSNALIPPGFLSNGSLALSGRQSLTLTTGTYALSGLSLSGQASLNTSGPVSIFVSGPVHISGSGRANAQGPASHLVVFSSMAVAFGGGARFSGILYAPQAALNIAGGAQLSGHFFAQNAGVSGSASVLAGEVAPISTLGLNTADVTEPEAAVFASMSAWADPAFVYRDSYAFPNPARGSESVTFRLQAGLADSVDVKVYDVSGRQVYGGNFGSAQIMDDGNGKGAQYAYDHAWNTGRVGSGVYLFLITAHKAGFPDIRKTGKAGVIK